MSQITTTSEIRAVFGGLWRQQVIDLLRASAFVGTLLLAWVSLRPFPDLSLQALKDVSTGNETMTYLAFGGLALLMFALAMREDAAALQTLFCREFLLLGGWIVINVVISLDPDTSIRRFALTVCVIAVTSVMMLLPKSQSEFSRWLAIAALSLLAICYLGALLAPKYAIHLPTDTQEPQLAGDWRGCFGHKNVASAMMAMLLFFAIYIFRAGSRLTGAVIFMLAAFFLFKAEGKSSTALFFVILALTSLAMAVRAFWLRAFILLTPLVIMNLFSVGTVMSPTLASIVEMLPIDATFTGRVDIWTFAIESLQARLMTGYGFSAFWGGSSIQNLPQGMEWAEFASHSHNGYLDTALTLGLPGLALLLFALVFAPLRNFQTAERNGNGGPLTTLLLQIWLFALYLSSMESFFLDRVDPMWFTLLITVFGLHYLARFRIRD